MNIIKRLGLGALLLSAACSATAKEVEVWELRSVPLQQMRANCSAMPDSGTPRENTYFFPDCNIIACTKEDTIYHAAFLDDSLASEFECWFRQYWLNDGTLVGPVQEDAIQDTTPNVYHMKTDSEMFYCLQMVYGKGWELKKDRAGQKLLLRRKGL